MIKEGLTASQYLYSLLGMSEQGSGGTSGKGGSAVWTTQETTGVPTSKPTLETDGQSTGGEASNFIGVFLGTATSVDFKVHCYVDGEWGLPRAGTFEGQTESYLERADTVGVERIFIQVVATDGTVTLKSAPVTFGD